MRFSMQALLGGLLAAGLAASGYAQDIISDGDFSSDPGMPPWYTSSSLSTANAHSSNGSPDGWSAYVPAGFDLGQTTDHTIVAGELYTVSYLAACISSINANTRVALWYLNDGMMPSPIADAGASQSLSLTSADGWKPYSFTFMPVAGEDYIGKRLGICLACTSPGDVFAGFDTVSIETIPEPSAAAVLLTGLLCLSVAFARHMCRC
jgi:hypothetical protein